MSISSRRSSTNKWADRLVDRGAGLHADSSPTRPARTPAGAEGRKLRGSQPVGIEPGSSEGGRGAASWSAPAKANGKRRRVPPWDGRSPEFGKGVPPAGPRPPAVRGVPVRQCVLVGGTGKMKRDPAAR